MTEKQTDSTLDTNRVATDEPTRGTPDMTATNPPGTQATSTSTLVNPLYPPQGPSPQGADPAIAQQMKQESMAKGANAPGVEGEQVVWEARYSMKNFIGRLTLWVLLSLAWIALAIYTWGAGHSRLVYFTIPMGIVVGFLGLWLLYRIIRARYGHRYQLTNRRLFVSTGLARRRRDQLELLRVKDVYTRQTLFERWVSVGTVVVVSTEDVLPMFYLTGVSDPIQVMDLVWHCARAEREGKTVQVENL